MKLILTIIMAVLCFAPQPMSAQKKEGTGEYKCRKAIDILEDGGDPQEARKLIDENISEYPDHIPSYFVRASLDRNDGDYGTALKVIDKAMDKNHRKSGITDANLLWWKATVYDEMGDTRKGMETMLQVVKMARKEDKANLRDMLETLAQFHYDLGQFDESDAVYKEMISMDEADQLPMVGLARNMIARERYDEALSILDDCSKYDSSYEEIYRFQVKAYYGKKDYKKMIDVMVKLSGMSEDYEYLDIEMLKHDKKYAAAVLKGKIASEKDNAMWKLALADFHMACYRYSDAVGILNGLIDEYGNNPDLLEMRADCYLEMGMVEESLADFTKCIDMSDGGTAAFFRGMRAHAYRCGGMYPEAVRDFSAYVDYYPTDAYGYYSRGWCHELSGDDEAAMEDYDNGIAVDEDYPYIYLMRGEINLKRGKRELAESDFELVILKDTIMKDGSCRQYALHFLGRDDEALEWMEKLIEEDPDNPGPWYDKCCLLARMGRPDESVAALEAAFERGFRRFPHIEHDDDVDTIRDREDFKAIVRKYRQKFADESLKLQQEVIGGHEELVSEVDMRKVYGGTYEVACSVNGLPLKMIFDTGAADVTISSVEANFMLKNGYLSEDDIRGRRNYITASGDIHEGTVLRLKEVKLGDAVLKNVEASVVHSQKAPLLLGQSVLEKFGTITIDNVNSRILIRQ